MLKCRKCGAEGPVFGYVGLCKTDYEEYKQREIADWHAKSDAARSPRRDLKAAVAAHPSGEKSYSPLTTWMSHHYGCQCEKCQYVEHHMDDAEYRWEWT